MFLNQGTVIWDAKWTYELKIDQNKASWCIKHEQISVIKHENVFPFSEADYSSPDIYSCFKHKLTFDQYLRKQDWFHAHS